MHGAALRITVGGTARDGDTRNAAGWPGGVEGGDAGREGPSGDRQWEQERGEPASSPVRKLEPQPQPETAFGLLTVKPAPMRVST